MQPNAAERGREPPRAAERRREHTRAAEGARNELPRHTGTAARPRRRAPGAEGVYLAEASAGWPGANLDSVIRRVTEIGGYPEPISAE